MAKDNSTYLALNAIFQEVHDPKKYDKFEEYREKNQKESESKSDTNGRQTVDKLATNGRQTVDKLTTNCRQTVDDTVDKLATNGRQTVDKLATNWRQTVDDTVDDTVDKHIEKFPFNDLQGIQRAITIYIYFSCIKTQSFLSEKISIKELVETAKTPIRSVKKSILRLRDKGIISKYKYKAGRYGWTIYEIDKNTYKEMTILRDKLATNGRQTVDDTVDDTVDKAPCSSSYNYNNEITTTTELPSDWQSIDFCKLNEKIYFGMNDLKNIYKAGKLTSAEFQQSIHGFAYRLENDEKFRREIKNKKSYFMSTSLDGGSFHDPEKVQILKKQKEAEEMMAHYQEQDRLRAIQDRQREENFRVWCDGLNPQKKDEILAKLSPEENTFIHRKAALIAYYEENELES